MRERESFVTHLSGLWTLSSHLVDLQNISVCSICESTIKSKVETLGKTANDAATKFVMEDDENDKSDDDSDDSDEDESIEETTIDVLISRICSLTLPIFKIFLRTFFVKF